MPANNTTTRGNAPLGIEQTLWAAADKLPVHHDLGATRCTRAVRPSRAEPTVRRRCEGVQNPSLAGCVVSALRYRLPLPVRGVLSGDPPLAPFDLRD